MKSFIKDFALDDRKRAKQIAAAHLQQSRRPPMLLSQSLTEHNKQHSIPASEGISSSSEFSTNFKRSITLVPDSKTFKSMLDIDNSSVTDLTPSTLVGAQQIKSKSNVKPKRLSKTAYKILSSTNEEEKLALPIIISPTSNAPTNYSSLTNKLETVINANKKDFQPLMSSADAFTVSSSRMTFESNQRKITKKRELFTDIEQSVEKQLKDQPEKITNPLSTSFPNQRKTIDVEIFIPLPDHPTVQRSSPIKSRLDFDIRQATVKPYERYASATTRSTAVHCLQEAGYFKGKSWLKQVEIGKEMVKHHVKRRIRRADDETKHKPVLLPLRTNAVRTSANKHRPNAVKVN
jgi:hypothetical protein